MTPRESRIESYLNDQVARAGGDSYKFKSTVNGVPDRIVLFDGKTHFVEVKRPNGKLRPTQVTMHKKFAKQKIQVHVVDTKDKVDAFIQDVLGVTEFPERQQVETGTIRRLVLHDEEEPS